MAGPARTGDAAPDGPDHLYVTVDGNRFRQRQVGRLPGAVCVQAGDDEKSYRVPVGAFPALDAVLRFKRKRVLNLTPEQRDAARRRMAAVSGRRA